MIMDAVEFLRLVRKGMKSCPKYAPDFTDEDVLAFWFDIFKEVDFLDFKRAFIACLHINPSFPTIGEINNKLRPSEIDTAVKIQTELIMAISRFGYANEADARSQVGEVAWEVMKQFSGSWAQFCTIPEVTKMLMHQLKEFANVVLKRNQREGKVLQLREGKNWGQLSSVSNLLAESCERSNKNKISNKLQGKTFSEIVKKE